MSTLTFFRFPRSFIARLVCALSLLLVFPTSQDSFLFSKPVYAAQKKKAAKHSVRKKKTEEQVKKKRSLGSRYRAVIEEALNDFRKRRAERMEKKMDEQEKTGALPPATKALPKLRTLVTSLYGERRSLGPDSFYFHSGLDIRAHLGWSIVAFRDGLVTKSGRNGNAGIMVEIDHENGLSSLYAHMRRATVAEGERVVAGEKIGEVGCTGRTTGAHLHIAIRKNGQTVDPLRYLKRAEDVLRPRDDEITDVIAPQQCNGHFSPYTPAAANRRVRGPIVRGRHGKPVRIDLNALRNYRPPEIPQWRSRQR